MCCTGKGTVFYDETSSDSNASITRAECSDDLNMLYLLASVAEEVSLDRLHALATAANFSADATSKQCESPTTELPSATKMTVTKVDIGGCDERRLFRMKCPFCCRCFSRKENLRWHMKKHVKERVPEDSTATTPTFSASHSLADQTAEDKRQADSRLGSSLPDSSGFWCVKCEKNFQREATFRVHMRFHSRKRPALCLPLPCKKCAELCTTKTQYLIHKKMHRMEKIFRRRGLLPEPATPMEL